MKLSTAHLLLLGVALAAPVEKAEPNDAGKQDVQDDRLVTRGLAALNFHFLPRSPVAPIAPKPVSPARPPPNNKLCKKSSCGAGEGNSPPRLGGDDPNPGPARPNSNSPAAGDDTIPPRVDRPENGEQIHNNLRGAIARNEPEVIRPAYTANGAYRRDWKRADEPDAEVPMSDSNAKNLFEDAGFNVRDKRWKPAVMDRPGFNFEYEKAPSPRRRPSPDSDSDEAPSTPSTKDGGEYTHGEPMVENYHDRQGGSVITKSQLKPENDDTNLPFSEKSYQMIRDDFGPNPDIKRFGVTDIINEGWLQKANIHLADTPDFQWKNFERGTPGYNDFLGSDNGKWIGFMMGDHHAPMGNKDIVRIRAAKETLPDGTTKGYMAAITGPPQ
jgi:hypothetical protein